MGEPLGDRGVALIDVAAEFERPVIVDEGGLIDDKDGDRLGQVVAIGRAEVNRLGDVVLRNSRQ